MWLWPPFGSGSTRFAPQAAPNCRRVSALRVTIPCPSGPPVLRAPLALHGCAVAPFGCLRACGASPAACGGGCCPDRHGVTQPVSPAAHLAPMTVKGLSRHNGFLPAARVPSIIPRPLDRGAGAGNGRATAARPKPSKHVTPPGRALGSGTRLSPLRGSPTPFFPQPTSPIKACPARRARQPLAPTGWRQKDRLEVF